jgi:hypothetical protein
MSVKSRNGQELEKPSDDEGIERAYILSIEEERTYFAFLRREGISEHGNLHDVGRLMIQQGLRQEEAMALPKKMLTIIVFCATGKKVFSSEELLGNDFAAHQEALRYESESVGAFAAHAAGA